MCMCASVCVRMLVYVCISAYDSFCTCASMFVFVYMCACVCVCACVRARVCACVRVRVNAVNASVCIQQTHCMFVLQNKPNILWNPGPAKPSTGSCAGGFEWEDESQSQQMLCVY